MECRCHEIGEEMERVPPLKLARSGHGEDPFGEAFTIVGLVAETEFAPLYRWPQGAFSPIVGWFDPLVKEEGKEVFPVLEGTAGPSAYLSIRAILVLEAVPFDAGPHQDGGISELLPSDVAVAKSVPATQNMSQLPEQVFGEKVGIRAGPGLLEAFELEDQVGQAQLAKPFAVEAPIRGMIVGGDDAVKGLPEDGLEHLGAPTGGDGEIDHQGRDQNPQVARLSLALPSRFIDVEMPGFGKGFPDFFGNGLECGTDTVQAVAHGAQTQVQAEQGVHDLNDAPSADLVDRTQIGDGSVDCRAELTVGHFRGNGSPGPVPAGASQLMTAVLGHNGLDLG